jgi:hypothetical protein
MHENDHHDNPLLPWYALLVVGILLGGFMTWLIVAWFLIKHNQIRVALVAITANILAGVAVYFINVHIGIPWWRLGLIESIGSLIWALCAIVVQHKLLGPAPRRFYFSRWKAMLPPLLTSVLLGFCGGAVFGIPSVINTNSEIQQTMDILDRTSIIFDIFRYGLTGIPFGLFAGIWWSLSASYFRPSTIIANTFGAIFSSIIFFLVMLLWIFITHDGYMGSALKGGYYSLTLPWASGIQHSLLAWDLLSSYFGIICMGLLFGSPSRMSEFWPRMILPILALLCSLPFFNGNPTFDAMYQDQLFYNLANPNPDVRAAAQKKLETFLKQYPDCGMWSYYADKHAQYLYDEKRFTESKAWWRKSIKDKPSFTKWSPEKTAYIKTILGNDLFGKGKKLQLDIPPTDYESYLNEDWIALTALIQYWEKDSVPESGIKMRLKKFSSSDEKINLNRHTTFLDIDDAGRSMGYEVSIVKAQKQVIIDLLNHGIPVLYPIDPSVCLAWGYDEGRSTLHINDYSKILQRTRKEARREADVIMAKKREGHGRNEERLQRIALECRCDIDLSLMEKPAGKYSEPLMAIIYPHQMKDTVAALVQLPGDELDKTTNGYRAALISLSYLDMADPKDALQWAVKASSRISDFLPYHTGYLCALAWEKKSDSVLSAIPLAKQFPVLASIDSAFTKRSTLAFLDSCKSRFETDRDSGTLTKMILNRYFKLLTLSRSEDRQIGLKTAKQELKLGFNFQRYNWIIRAVEWDRNPENRIPAYYSFCEVMPLNYSMKLRLATDLVRVNRYREADSVLKTIVADSVHYDADLYFCRAALDEWRGRPAKALTNYRTCIGMRRYRPEYFERYGNLLAKCGKSGESEKMLGWARQLSVNEPDSIVDSEGKIR